MVQRQVFVRKCNDCRSPAAPDRTTCVECGKKRTQYNRNKRLENRKKGLCNCGRERPSGFLSCEKCRGRRLPTKPGYCVCGRELDRPDLRSCQICRRIYALNTRAAVQKAKERGLCTFAAGSCGKKPSFPHTLCEEHLAYLRKTSKERNEKRKAANVCRQCAQPLPLGRTALCLRCQPSLSGKTNAQIRIEREKNQRRNLAIRNCVNEILEKMIDQSGHSPRDIAMVRMRAGLDIDNDRTLEEVGQHFGITRERVRQVESEFFGMKLADVRELIEKELVEAGLIKKEEALVVGG